MSGSTPKDVDSSSKGDADDAPATATVASTGWAYVGSDRHPAVVLDVKHDTKLFIITGTSNPGLTPSRSARPDPSPTNKSSPRRRQNRRRSTRFGSSVAVLSR